MPSSRLLDVKLKCIFESESEKIKAAAPTAEVQATAAVKSSLVTAAPTTKNLDAFSSQSNSNNKSDDNNNDNIELKQRKNIEIISPSTDGSSSINSSAFKSVEDTNSFLVSLFFNIKSGLLLNNN